MKRASPRILLIDDDAGVREVVVRALGAAGYDVSALADAAGARQALAEGPFDLAILDVNLPDANGLDLCGEIVARHEKLPVMMLTVVADESDIVRALEAGADDYVRKPFGTRELTARVQAVLRRAQLAETGLAPTMRVGSLSLDSTSYRVQIDDEPLSLTPTEYRLLALLAQNAGRVLTHDQLLQFVWGPGYEGEHHMLRVAMSRLRQKLGRLADTGAAIRTMPGVGYEFVESQN